MRTRATPLKIRAPSVSFPVTVSCRLWPSTTPCGPTPLSCFSINHGDTFFIIREFWQRVTLRSRGLHALGCYRFEGGVSLFDACECRSRLRLVQKREGTTHDSSKSTEIRHTKRRKNSLKMTPIWFDSVKSGFRTLTTLAVCGRQWHSKRIYQV
jgi:hypothetical protein